MAHLPQRVIATYIGFGLLAKAQSLRCIDGWRWWRLAVNEAMQHVENMGFGCNPILKRQFDGAQDGLFVMVQNKGEDLDHLLVTAKPLEQLGLQSPECLGHLEEGSTVAQCAGFALNDCQIMPPVIDRVSRFLVGPVNDPRVLAQDLSFRDDDKPLGVNAQTDGPIGSGCARRRSGRWGTRAWSARQSRRRAAR